MAAHVLESRCSLFTNVKLKVLLAKWLNNAFVFPTGTCFDTVSNLPVLTGIGTQNQENAGSYPMWKSNGPGQSQSHQKEPPISTLLPEERNEKDLGLCRNAANRKPECGGEGARSVSKLVHMLALFWILESFHRLTNLSIYVWRSSTLKKIYQHA